MTALTAAALMAQAVPAANAVAAKVDAVAATAALSGVVLVARGDRVLVEKGYGRIDPKGGAMHRVDARWPLASITKQVAATMLVAAHAPRLDVPDATDGLTLRQLLTHHSGLANPDDTPAPTGGMPSFYAKRSPDLAYCASKPARPGADFAYNNCDYLVAWQRFGGPRTAWPSGLRLARPGERFVPGFVGGKPQGRFELSSFGAAGGLTGTARDLLSFDRRLMRGGYGSPAVRDLLWTAEGGRSYQALGQWVFPATLKGCTAAKRIVQRDGDIQGIQTRNFILPDDDLVVIVFTNRADTDFAFGEIWQGRGFAFDLLSAVACA